MRERIGDARRVVVKLGSNLFFNEAGVIALGRIFSFIEEIGAARLAGRQMIVVSSGAVALGADALKMKSSTASLRQKQDRKSTRLNSSHLVISYAVFCLKKKKKEITTTECMSQR